MTEHMKPEGVVTMAEFAAKGESPEILLWIGCAGAYDERYKKVVRAIVRLLQMSEVSFGVLGPEESCTGDPARRAGNEFLFQMQAMANIQVLNGYGIKKILTACPHCYNTFKNEYPDLGGVYEVLHHTQFLTQLINEEKLHIDDNSTESGLKVTYHDSCYLGRSNGIYEEPRKLLEFLHAEKVEMDRHGKNAFCCGAGGAQMFKEPENGQKDINIERTEEALRTGAKVIATACPFCMTMLSDGIKNKEMEETVKVMDVAELLLQAKNA
jgi:Fe-S oxidoreductase